MPLAASIPSNTGAVYVDLIASTGIETALLTGTVGAANAALSTDYVFSFENLTGSAFGDRMYGTNVANVINGGAGDDIIYGLDGNDTLNGGDGFDRLVGGAGRDTMTGGAGTDRFIFSTAPEIGGPPPGAWDVITDFVSGTDSIYILRSAFGIAPAAVIDFVVNGTATSSNATFMYNTGTGILSFDADGNGAGNVVYVAELAPVPAAPALVITDIVLYG
jgi:Ca2+-binding RTX toxin-like protein